MTMLSCKRVVIRPGRASAGLSSCRKLATIYHTRLSWRWKLPPAEMLLAFVPQPATFVALKFAAKSSVSDDTRAEHSSQNVLLAACFRTPFAAERSFDLTAVGHNYTAGMPPSLGRTGRNNSSTRMLLNLVAHRAYEYARKPVGIIGAGIAGLTAAHFLRRNGMPVILLESGQQVAGMARSYVDERGFHYDFGAHFITNRLAAAVGVAAHAATCRTTANPFW